MAQTALQSKPEQHFHLVDALVDPVHIPGKCYNNICTNMFIQPHSDTILHTH